MRQMTYCALCRENQAEVQHHVSYHHDITMGICDDCHHRIHYGDLWKLNPKAVGSRAIKYYNDLIEGKITVSDLINDKWKAEPENWKRRRYGSKRYWPDDE